jgi:single-strand DNA-binding protein
MANVNLVVLAGGVTKDPELKYTPTGQAVCDLTMAINRRFTDQRGEKREETCFVDITIWGRQAENVASYIRKGRRILVEGRLVQDRWEGPNGQKRSRIRVSAYRVQFLDRISKEAEPIGMEDVAPGAEEPFSEEDIPF